MKKVTLILFITLVAAGCAGAAIATPASTPTPTPVGYVSPAGGNSTGVGLITVELEMDHAPRVGETVVLTCTVRPAWTVYTQEGDLEAKPLHAWVVFPPGIEPETPPGMTRLAPDDLPWDCAGCSSALEGNRVVEQGEVWQFAIPLHFLTEGPGWGGFTYVDVMAEVLVIPGYGDSRTLILTVTKDFSHFGYPEGWSDQPTYPEGVTPPPTPLMGQPMAPTPVETVPPPPRMTAGPTRTPRPTRTPEPTVSR